MASSSRVHSVPLMPDSYTFNNFITDICKKITEEDLNELKYRLKGIITDDVQNPRAMFNALIEKGFVDCHNIIFLQQLLRALEKEELLEIVTKYVYHFGEDKVLHIFKKTTKTADGSEIVEFHVKGRIASNEDIEAFRWKVSRILCVPLFEVIISGVQETRSLLITVMLPKFYADFLMNQLRTNKQHIIASFLQLQVDEILVSADKFQLQKDGSFFIAKKISVSAQNVHLKGKRKATKEEQERKPSSLKTDERPLHEQTKKRRMCVKPRPEKSIVTRSHTQQSLPPMMGMVLRPMPTC
ncbi:uncharacterized protein LOC123553575 [Mercenaria mercenaria]|uniref:uncharacterized protein LOC123553575 n=1 Tax=Mercenaria mercenaria TaxID=6596 RepID=UPI00234E8D0E|nr:uncharacterized protein LOC123553575 [Mercenaria mercenaria]